MKRKKLLWKLLPPYLVLAVAALAFPSFITSAQVKNFYINSVKRDLESRAQLLQGYFLELITANDTGIIDKLCKQMGRESETRITVVTVDGVVLGDSDNDPGDMENHGDRPEIVEAIESGSGSSVRFSDTMQQEMVYTAVRVTDGDKTTGTIRTSIPIEAIDALVASLLRRIVAGGIAIVVIGLVISLFGLMKISTPLGLLTKLAERHSQGDLERSDVETDVEEIWSLSEAMNTTARELDSRIKMIVRQRNELEAVLSSMIEGLIAVDMKGDIININRTACEMAQAASDSPKGMNIDDATGNPDIREFISRTLKTTGVIEEEISLRHRDSVRAIQAHGKLLTDEDGTAIGALVVMNDITQLRKLETMRRDFVANVSHELKTPITTIKGSVENLFTGALYDREDAERFLTIIDKHSDRMNAIINDLLTLSKLDQDTDKKEITLEETAIADILSAVVRECGARAEKKNITLEVSCDESLKASVSGRLLEQAIVNLVDNAIKYSDSETKVTIEAVECNGHMCISVTDSGMGIDSEHLPRVFERFYRVDKARSRKLGGTGLGLAIVKHIAQAHGGRAEGKSVPGEGSTFTIYIPS